MTSRSDAAELVAATGDADPRDGRGVARNFLFLVAAQIATAAVSLAVTAMLARHLGAHDYGVFYLAATLVQTVFVFADLGQQYYVVSRIAQDRRAAATLLVNGLLLRLLGGVAIWPLLAGLAAALDYPDATRVAISLTVVFFLAGAFAEGAAIVLRGLERMDVEAAVTVAARVLIAAAIALAVIAKGGLHAVLVGQVVGALAGIVVYGFALYRLDVGRPRLSVSALQAIVWGGAPFLLWAIAVNLQPAVDALLLSLLAPANVIGWYAAAWRLIGLLTFPATILAGALYPTLSRLQARPGARYGDLIGAALRVVVLTAVLSTVGTYLFADTAVALIYGGEFGPAAQSLRVLAAYVLLAFVDITLGTAIMAAGGTRAWVAAKLVAVMVAAGLSVVLIPVTQAAMGNGGIGSAAATVAAELMMFVTAVRLVPVPTTWLAAELSEHLARGVAAALVMIVAASMLRDGNPFGRIAVSVAAYLATIVLLGAIGREDLRFVRDAVRIQGRA
jgi:O-antigen/teichoic acid export membrane protein